jgi:hypothetical protein
MSHTRLTVLVELSLMTLWSSGCKSPENLNGVN